MCAQRCGAEKPEGLETTSMKRIKYLAMSVLAAVSALPVLVHAQSARRVAVSDPVLSANADSTAPRTKASAAASVSFANMMSAMSALPDRSARLVRVRGLKPEHITLVDVRNLFRYTDDQKNFEKALSQYERQVTAMRSTLQGSLVLRDLLYERQLSMTQVMAVDVTPDGRATVFYLPE
jgi:hypothetical protein